VEKETRIESSLTLTEAGQPKDEKTRANEKGSGVRTATKDQLEKAHGKTRTLHAGLLRRLAK
jgi:hypothetical protein